MKYDACTLVKIHLTRAARRAAAFDLFKRRKQRGRTLRQAVRDYFRFTGPCFKLHGEDGDLEVAVGQTTVNVVVDGNIEYVYPLSTVGRIKIIG